MRQSCLSPWLVSLFVSGLALSACASAEEKAAAATAQYEFALAAGDLAGARNAMLRAVQAKDDVASYWIALARVHVQMRQFADAHYAYMRAVELDRTNIEALQSLSEIALASGRVAEAERYTSQVELLDPQSLGAVTTRGFIALRGRNFDEAIRRADQVLARLPSDPNAKILKARALQGVGDPSAGARLLEDHLQTRGDDQMVLRALLTLYRQEENGGGVLDAGARLLALAPQDPRNHFEHLQDLYRLGRPAAARPIALALIQEPNGKRFLADILSLWLSYEKRSISVSDADRLAQGAAREIKLLFARFFLEAGQPVKARELLASLHDLPVTSTNADALAVLGRARLLSGQITDGLQLIEAVLDYDGTNILALRARADHNLSNRQYDRALADALRLVRENPSSPQDRLRLAEVYTKLGNNKLAESTYWTAFRDVPGSRQLHAALRAYLARYGQVDAVAAVDRQFEEQKKAIRDKLISA
jgi:tetratricopeptide (TPR) repeat protein